MTVTNYGEMEKHGKCGWYMTVILRSFNTAGFSSGARICSPITVSDHKKMTFDVISRILLTLSCCHHNSAMWHPSSAEEVRTLMSKAVLGSIYPLSRG